MTKLIASFLLLASLYVQAQMHNGKYGNEWIQHHQNYFKFKLSEEGFYRISRSVLERDIPFLDTINPTHFQLLHQGNTVPIYVHQAQGIIEYIDFYAHVHHAALDRYLYEDTSHHFNPSYSLICDSSTYFMTWSAGQNNHFENKPLDFNQIEANDTFFMHRTKQVFNQHWNEGTRYYLGGKFLSKSSFEKGEGFGSGFSNQHSTQLNCPFLISNSTVNATFETKVYSCGQTHQIQVQINNYVQPLASFNTDSVLAIQQTFPSSILNVQNTLNLSRTNSSNNQLNTSQISINYPRQFNFGGQHCFPFNLRANPQKKLLKVDNFDGGPAANNNLFLYNLTQKQRTPCWWDGQTLQTVLWPSNTACAMVLVNSDSIRKIQVLQPVQFQNYEQSRGEYLIITHPYLMQDAMGRHPIFDYAAYRSLGGHAVSVHNIMELYDQFAYGTVGHPLAIKNFVAYIQDQWPSKPQHLFLIGKGRKYQTIRHSATEQQLVPSYGYPPSDNLLVAPRHETTPSIPVGRLSVVSPEQIYQYLDKVKAIETTAQTNPSFDNQSWRKNILHLAGGTNSQEQGLFQYYLNNMASFAKHGKHPKQLSSFCKIQDQFQTGATTEIIDSLINHGVSMISFFGHGSNQGFDYYLNSPEYYSNVGRYPHILAMGCHNGTLYESSPQISEKYVLAENAGAVSYLSFVDVVFANCAYLLGFNFYNLSQNNYPNASIGKISQQSIEQLKGYPGDIYELARQYFVLHGDPALKLNASSKPDFALDSKGIRTIPASIQSSDRMFQLEIDVYNWACKKDTVIDLEIVQKLPTGKQIKHYKQCFISSVHQSIQLNIPINGYAAIGWHEFSAHIDYENHIDEGPAICETNNRIEQYAVHIGPGTALAAFPKEYALINDIRPTLVAVHPNAIEIQKNWFLELDTTANFNSPLLKQHQLSSSGNIFEWQLVENLKEEQVYYWRVRTTQADQKDIRWSESSFMYQSNKQSEGWNQSHFQQYQNNQFQQLIPPTHTGGALEFEKSCGEIAVQCGYIRPSFPDNAFQLLYNGSIVDKCKCPDKNGIYVAVFNPTTESFWTLAAGNNNFGALNCDASGRTAYSFLFENFHSTGRQNLSNFIRNVIPNNHLVFMYTLNNGYGNNLAPELVSYLKQIGALQIDSFIQNPSMPYALSFFKNTQHAQLKEQIGSHQSSILKINNTFGKTWHEGSMRSPLIGPAKNWKGLEFAFDNVEGIQADSVTVQIWGLDHQGTQQLLMVQSTAAYVDISHIDAQQYPFIYLVFINQDPLFRTASKLQYWRVYAQLIHDLALSVRKTNNIHTDSASAANGLELMIHIENNSPDDILEQSVFIYINRTDSIEIAPLSIPAFESIDIPLNIPLNGLEGIQKLVLELSPIQEESYLINNWGWMNIDVFREELFDGLAEQSSELNKLSVYPNPFIESTTINLELDAEIGDFDALIFDNNGRIVRRLHQLNQGMNQIQWDGKSMSGAALASGSYYVQILAKKPISEQMSAIPILKLIKQ